jgi:hypothetical protein
VSEIAIEYCAVPPHMAIGTMCRPSTTKEEDGIKGNWVRVEGNLNAQTSIFFLVSLPVCLNLVVTPRLIGGILYIAPLVSPHPSPRRPSHHQHHPPTRGPISLTRVSALA